MSSHVACFSSSRQGTEFLGTFMACHVCAGGVPCGFSASCRVSQPCTHRCSLLRWAAMALDL